MQIGMQSLNSLFIEHFPARFGTIGLTSFIRFVGMLQIAVMDSTGMFRHVSMISAGRVITGSKQLIGQFTVLSIIPVHEFTHIFRQLNGMVQQLNTAFEQDWMIAIMLAVNPIAYAPGMDNNWVHDWMDELQMRGKQHR